MKVTGESCRYSRRLKKERERETDIYCQMESTISLLRRELNKGKYLNVKRIKFVIVVKMSL